MIEHKDIFIDTTPFCFWGDHLSSDNKEFLQHVDSNYYFTMACNLGAAFEEDQPTAILIRLLYGQALECLFAFISAYVQSPHCIIGWLSKYRNDHLRACVSKLDRGSRLPTMFKGAFHGWDDVSRQINSYFPPEKRAAMIEGYALLWTNLAREFLDEDFQYENNSLKHGSRVIPGGMHLSIGAKHEYSIPPPENEMQLLGGSDFGATYYVPLKIGSRDKTDNLLIHEHTRNWNPANLLRRLSLISFSLNNIVSACRIANGEAPEELMFTNPSRIESFEEVFSDIPGVLGWQRFCSVSAGAVSGHFHGLRDVESAYSWE
ncbi:MAG: hypothetical protein AB1407_05415 [Spirochaetota bacterium]